MSPRRAREPGGGRRPPSEPPPTGKVARAEPARERGLRRAPRRAGRPARSRAATTGAGGAGGLAGAAPVFAALGDETRLGLVARLCTGGPMSIVRLTAGAGVTRQAVTKHLHVLGGAGLVRGARAGRDHVWQIEPARLDEVRRWLDHLEGQWDEALSRLKASLEKQ